MEVEGMKKPRSKGIYLYSKSVITHSLFWINLLELCFLSWQDDKGQTSEALISYRSWMLVIYKGKDSSRLTKSRAWARWKKRLRDLGMLELESYHGDKTNKRLGVVVTISTLFPVGSAILGIDDAAYNS